MAEQTNTTSGTPDQMKYLVTTTPHLDGRIVQLFECESNGVRATIWRQVMNTAEKSVRDALIQLGWTPPRGDSNG